MTPELDVNYVTWRSDGRPDLFVVVFASHACPYWLAMADVIVHPTEPSMSAADQVAADTLRRWPGCALAAVGVQHRGCLVRTRWDQGQLCPGDGSDRNTVESAKHAYLVWART